MRKNFDKKSLYRVLGVIGVFAAILPAYAVNEAILSGIEINPSETNGSYQIIVKTDRNVPIEQHITADNKIVLDMKNVKPASFVNTIYNNSPNIDHVIVQPVSNNEVRIFVQGQNVSSSAVTLDTTAGKIENAINQIQAPITTSSAATPATTQTGTQNAANSNADATVVSEQAQPRETIVLDRPIESYKPVAYDNSESQTSEDTSLDEVQNSMTGSSFFNKSNFGWVLSFIMMIILAAMGLKLFGKKKNIKVNLSSGLKEKDLDLYSALNNRRGLLGSGLGASRFDEIETRPGYNSFSRYGLKEYQNNQLPRTAASLNVSKIRMEPAVTPLNNQAILKTMPRTAKTTISPNKVRNNDMRIAKSNIDNVKFLETMAKIYERSGRVDLAKGLQNSILKAQNG